MNSSHGTDVRIAAHLFFAARRHRYLGRAVPKTFLIFFDNETEALEPVEVLLKNLYRTGADTEPYAERFQISAKAVRTYSLVLDRT